MQIHRAGVTGNPTDQLLSTYCKYLAILLRGTITKALAGSYSLGIPNIPLELFDIIFDFVGEDITSLLHFTLVSKLWYQVALRHVYATLRVVEAKDLNARLTFLPDYLHIAQCIKELRLIGSVYPHSALDCNAFTTILPHLTALKCITIHNVTMHDFPSRLLAPRYPLQTLRVGQLGNPPESADLLSLSSLLCILAPDTLDMSFGVFPYMQDSPNTGPPTPHSVQVRRLLLPHEMYDAERYRYFNCILSPHRTLLSLVPPPSGFFPRL